MVNAENNWWGDPSGPGGSGPGSGDEVSDYVNYQNWRTELVSLVVIGAPDTVYQQPAVTDTLFASVLNWDNPNDVVDITLTDSLGWLTGQTSFTVTIDDSLGASFPIIVSVPGGTPSNTINKVSIDAVSQNNSNQTDSDEFYVITYTPELVRIVIAPDSVGLTVGDSLQFTATGYDQFNQSVSFTPEWSSILGTIDDNGLYITPSSSGIDTVTVMDNNTQLTANAIVVVGNPTGIKNEKPVLPKEYTLYQNYPNPFNPSTVIRFALPEAGNVVLEIYNILGQRVARLVNEEMNAGYHEVNFNAQNLASGIYIYRIVAKGFVDVKKMILLK